MKKLLFAVLLFPMALWGQVQVAPFLSPNQQFFDNSGSVLAGGKVCTFQAGTTTPLTSYSDSAGTVPNANPVVLDSSGRGTIFLQSAAYKIVVAASTANSLCSPAITTADNVTWNNLAQTLSSLTVTGAVKIQTSVAATSGANQSSPTLEIWANVWNGSNSIPDKYICQNVPGSGSNPATALTCTHSGSSGAASLTINLPVALSSTLTTTNAGTFTNTQMNDVISALVNNCSTGTEFHVGFPGNNATEVTVSCLTVGSGSTVFQANTHAAYISNSSTTTNAVAGFFQSRALAATTNNWALNALFMDGGFQVRGAAAEFDCNIANLQTTGACVQINGGGWVGNPGSYPALQIAKPGGGQWSALVAQGTAGNAAATAFTTVDDVSPEALNTNLGADLNRRFNITDGGNLGYQCGWAISPNIYFYCQPRNNVGANNTAYPIVLNPLGGNIGAGVTNPAEKVDVAGSIKETGALKAVESAAPSCAAGQDMLWGDSTTHSWKACNNNGAAVTVPYREAAQSWTAQQYFPSNTFFVTSDFTTANNTSLQAITGLSWTMPASTALNMPFTCELLYSQATAAVSDQFGIQDVTVAPTNLMVAGDLYTNATAKANGSQTAINSTTATAFITFTPGATATNFSAHISGFIEQPSNASTSVVQLMIATSNGADAITIRRGSFCKIF